MTSSNAPATTTSEPRTGLDHKVSAVMELLNCSNTISDLGEALKAIREKADALTDVDELKPITAYLKALEDTAVEVASKVKSNSQKVAPF